MMNMKRSTVYSLVFFLSLAFWSLVGFGVFC